jgi:hypothetical protein
MMSMNRQLAASSGESEHHGQYMTGATSQTWPFIQHQAINALEIEHHQHHQHHHHHHHQDQQQHYAGAKQLIHAGGVTLTLGLQHHSSTTTSGSSSALGASTTAGAMVCDADGIGPRVDDNVPMAFHM